MDIHWANITLTATAVASTTAAGIAGWIAGKTQKATEAQASATTDAARAAEASVKAADAAGRIADTLAKIEIDRRHEEMYPDVEIGYAWERNERTQQFNLFAYVTSRAPRDYQVEATQSWDSGSSTLIGVQDLGGGQTARFHIGDETSKLCVTLRLEFDAVDPCPCPRRTPSGRHWPREFAIPQDPPSRPATINTSGQRGSRL